MKSYSGLYSQIYDFSNIYDAYLKARKNKRYKQEILAFSANLEENLIEIQNELIYRSYEPKGYRTFKVFEPKERQIMAAPFSDRVVHHAVCNIIEPLIDKSLIYHSYACRKNKGTHACMIKTQQFLREISAKSDHEIYCFKGDISKYFASINHQILRKLIRRKIRCKDTITLLDKIINSTAEGINPVGLPLGNLTSQLFANLYLNEFDKFIKQEKKMKYYIRYMDDFIVLCDSRQELKQLRKESEIFLNENLQLKTNRKTCLFPIKQGIDFIGYRIWKDHCLLRKANVKHIRRTIKKLARDYLDKKIELKKIEDIVTAWLGHASHADVYFYREKIKNLVNELKIKETTHGKIKTETHCETTADSNKIISIKHGRAET